MSQVRVRRLSFYVFSTCQYSVVGSQTSYLGHVSNPLFLAGFQSNSCGHTTDFYLGKTDLPRANSSKICLGKFISGFVLPR